MKKYKIGETFQLNGVNLLILDYVGENPFVLAYNLGIREEFDEDNNYYTNSILKTTCESWFATSELKAIPRKLDLVAVNGETEYGYIEVEAAPLTFDEWRKYHDIITFKKKEDFWTVTPWGNYNLNFVCFVTANGNVDYDDCDSDSELAPAFILDSSFYFNDLESFTDEELLTELLNRKRISSPS
jgi:hypothetical protein